MTGPTTRRDDWARYYEVVAARPPCDLLRHTLHRFAPSGASRLAIDLGCGAGNESREFLSLGWRLVAIDQQPEGLARHGSATKSEHQARLATRQVSFAGAALQAAEFIWAGASLPFAAPASFPGLRTRILAALKPGGHFAGDLFGPRHAWADREDMNFHPAAQIEELCRGLHLEYFITEKGEKITATSGPLHWQAFALVARTPGAAVGPGVPTTGTRLPQDACAAERPHR
jgi:SAM-dependent methyltransferase